MNTAKENFENLKMKMLNWANQFNIFCFLDNNRYSFEQPAFECLLAVGCERSYTFTGANDFDALQHFFDENPSWLFGHLGYNAANSSYAKTTNGDGAFGKGFFFEPEIILKLAGNNIEVIKSNKPTDIILKEIANIESSYVEKSNSLNRSEERRVGKEC